MSNNSSFNWYSSFEDNQMQVLLGKFVYGLRWPMDMIHAFSVIFLFYKIITDKSCKGISLKTQKLYLIIYISRYIDLVPGIGYPLYGIGIYVLTMKILFIVCTGYIVYSMIFRSTVSQTYDSENDTVRIVFFIIFSSFLTFLYPVMEFCLTPICVIELFWTFSVYLESFAIFPQLWQYYKTEKNEGMTKTYVCLLGSYRALYMIYYTLRYFIKYLNGPQQKIRFFLVPIECFVVLVLLGFIISKSLKQRKIENTSQSESLVNKNENSQLKNFLLQKV